MKDISIWLDNLKRDSYQTLTHDIECDILIIGGGITGISTAYFLNTCNKKVVLAEANELGCGATSRSTGKLTYLQDTILEKIANIYDSKTALKYLNSQKDAIALVKQIIIDNHIDCNLQEAPSYIFTNKKSNLNKITKTYNIINKYVKVNIQKEIPIKVKCIKSLSVDDTYVFHPTKFVLGLASSLKNTTIYENTRVLDLKRQNGFWLADTNASKIKAKEVILGCHYPFFILPYYFPFKTTLEKSFLVASKVDNIKLFSAINVDSNVLSMRYHKDNDNYFIMLSETNDLSKNIDNLNKKTKIINEMKKKFAPNIAYCWSNHDIMTFDYMPLVGKIDEDLYLATGYNTWGMTNGVLAGHIISDLVMNNQNEYATLFNPLRSLKNLPNLINYNLKNSLSFIDTKLDKKRNFYQSDVKIVKENGVWYGIYTDEDNIQHKVLNKCPHMKCNLSFNYHEKTWDCPCHGSRFDIDGNVIFGPSTLDIKVNKNSN